MTEWTYLFPDRASVPGPLKPHIGVFVNDMTHPRVGIHCLGDPMVGGGWSHEARPWLFGSLTMTHRLAAGGVAHWGLDDRYPMGNGQLIRAGTTSVRYLVGDRRVTQKDNLRAQREDPAFRQKYDLECGVCGDRLSMRSDKMQGPAHSLFDAGFREVALRAMRLAYTVATRQ